MANAVLDSYWVPLAGQDDIFLHFSIDLPHMLQQTCFRQNVTRGRIAVHAAEFKQGVCIDADAFCLRSGNGCGKGWVHKFMQITTPFIKLDSFLKAENAVSSGGEAKLMIAEGYILVNDVVELRRGRKLYPGDRVAFGKRSFLVE